jgi:7-carboxy-7-deazaguanine synthase
MLKSLNLVEIFASVQGETSFTGLPTTFIRLARCNLRCSWCDTTYSFGKGIPFTIQDILHTVQSKGCRYVCITGGEPLLQKNVYNLMSTLADLGYTQSLETGGSLSIAEVDMRVHVILDVKCPGSGMSQKNHWDNLKILQAKDEVKFVLKDRADYDFSKQIIQEWRLDEKVRAVLLSPVHGVLNPQTLVEWVLEDRLKIRLNLQLHKLIWPNETQGV